MGDRKQPTPPPTDQVKPPPPPAPPAIAPEHRDAYYQAGYLQAAGDCNHCIGSPRRHVDCESGCSRLLAIDVLAALLPLTRVNK